MKKNEENLIVVLRATHPTSLQWPINWIKKSDTAKGPEKEWISKNFRLEETIMSSSLDFYAWQATRFYPIIQE